MPRSSRGDAVLTGTLAAAAAFAGGRLLFLLLLAATCYILGRLLCRRLPLAGAVERIAVATSLGLAVLAHLAFFLALAGHLARGPLLVAFAAIHLAGLGAWRELAADLADRRKLGWGLAASAVGIPLFVLAFYPPTAFDATLYHLPFARAFAATGRLPVLLDLRFPVFPQLDELLFAVGLLLAGETAAHLVQLLSTLLTAALLVAWGRRAFPAPWDGRAGWLAATAFLGNPIAVHLGTSAYVEAGVTLFATAALYCAWRWSEEDGNRRWLALAALFAACAADVKYLGLFFPAAIAVWICARRTALSTKARHLLLFAVVALLFLAPWYGRIVWYTGNPVFPFFERVFGRSSWAPSIAVLPLEAARPDRAATAGAGRALEVVGSLASLPWDVTFERGVLNRQPPFSPFYLAALPLLAVAAFRDRRVRRLLLPAAAYVLFFPLLPRDSRYLTPALPILTLALGGSVAWLAEAFLRARGSRAAWAPALAISLGVLLFLPGWLYALYRIGRQGPLPVTAGQREAYLARQLPVYPAIAFLNGTGTPYTAYALFAENLRYFADGRFLGDWVGPARFATVLPAAGDPEALARRLRQLGADRLLIALDQAAFRPPATPAWSRRFRRLYGDAHAEVYEIASNPLPNPPPQGGRELEQAAYPRW